MREKAYYLDLKRLRSDHNLTQSQIARALDLSQSYLSQIERAQRRAPEALIITIAEHFNIDNIEEYKYIKDKISSPKISNNKTQNIQNSIVNSPESFYHGCNDKSEEKLETGNTDTLIKLLARSEDRYHEERLKVAQLQLEVERLTAELNKLRK